MSRDALYLDYQSTTPLDERVWEVMSQCYLHSGVFANASSEHAFGQAAQQLHRTAREALARLVNADPSEIVFTSGATEANNLALLGAAEFYQRKGKHLITVAT